MRLALPVNSRFVSLALVRLVVSCRRTAEGLRRGAASAERVGGVGEDEEDEHAASDERARRRGFFRAAEQRVVGLDGGERCAAGVMAMPAVEALSRLETMRRACTALMPAASISSFMDASPSFSSEVKPASDSCAAQFSRPTERRKWPTSSEVALVAFPVASGPRWPLLPRWLNMSFCVHRAYAGIDELFIGRAV